jgi:glycosyltransferase involved in cell wall biosynthesis
MVAQGPTNAERRGDLRHAGRSVSFVLPAFNEAGNIESAIRSCARVATDLGLRFEVIVVDDGSRDDTRAIVDRLAAADPRVRPVHHVRNRGYGAALKSGLFAARLDLVFFTDADLQFDVGEIGALLDRADEHAIVAGYRSPRQDPWPRRLNGWMWTRLVDTLFDVGVRDVDCAFKIFDRRIFDRIPIYSIGAFVNTEILVRAKAEGFTLCEVPVSHFPRRQGAATGAKPAVIVKALHELWLLRSEMRSLADRSPVPQDVETG